MLDLHRVVADIGDSPDNGYFTRSLLSYDHGDAAMIESLNRAVQRAVAAAVGDNGDQEAPLVRRLVLLKPATAVIDDLLPTSAGNARQPRQSGPPPVKEEEIRGDFVEDFDLRQLKETHFDSQRPGEHGALAWSIRLRRTVSN
jgi:hypothetical protein